MLLAVVHFLHDHLKRSLIFTLHSQMHLANQFLHAEISTFEYFPRDLLNEQNSASDQGRFTQGGHTDPVRSTSKVRA